VIVGGGLNSDNKEVFSEMIRLAGGVEKAVFAVIPAAGSSPVQSFQYYHQALMRYGIQEENIRLIKLSLSDDDSTTLVNEALWKDNAMNPEEVKKIHDATAVWFTGGDQMCILQTLVKADGSKSPMLEAVWEVYNKGGMIGGTSAGAAIMSNPMIGRGNSLFALTHDTIARFDEILHEDSDTLFITQGLGFFPFGIVDQHFHQRARIGRLITTMMIEKKQFHLGFGIDENTALIYDGKNKQLKVAGASGVTMIDVSNAETSIIDNFRSVENLNISYLENGDCFDLSTHTIIPASEKILISVTEKHAYTERFSSGSLSTYTIDFKGLITHRLFDGTNPTSIEDLNIIDTQSAYILRFSKKPETKAYKNMDAWTINDVRLDIIPAQINIISPKQIKTK
jgi:cyanophycinase